MANIVKIKRSAVASKIPTTADLQLGELAINTFDGKLFTKKDDGTVSIIEIGSGGGGITYSLKTANYTAKDKDGILADTSAGSFTVTLPAFPDIGASVVINDAADSFGLNNLTINRNGSTIETIADNLIIDVSSVSTTFIYTGTTWQVYSLVVAQSLGGSGGTTYLLKTANYTATNKDGILADTTAGSFTVTLPASPAIGDSVVINDAADSFQTNNLIVDRNGSTIETIADNLTLDLSGVSVSFVYTGTTWQVYSFVVANTSSITSSQIIAALGFTPYNATNPSGYTTNVGTVTSVAPLTIATAGTDITSSVATETTTPVITLNIPTASATTRGALNAVDWATFNSKQPAGTYATGTGSASGINTGDNAVNSLYSGLVSNATHTGDVTGSTALTLATVNSNIGTWNNVTVNAKGLVTGGSNTAYLTTVSPSNFSSQTANTILAAPNGLAGVPTFRAIVPADIPTLNQNTTGSAATLTTARTINGVSFDGSTNITTTTNTTNALTIGAGLSGTSFDGSGATTIAIDSTVATLTGAQTLTNKSLTSPTLTGSTSFTGTYHNSYLTQYGSLFIEGTSTNNIVQVSSLGVSTGGGLWSTGAGNTLFSNAGLYFKVGTTLRDRDTPTGGTIALSIDSNTNATFVGTVTANSVLLTGNTGTVTSVGGTGTVNGLTLTGTVTNSGSLTLGGTLSNVSLTSQVTDTLPVGNGGTGVTTLTTNNVILGNGTSAVQVVAPGTSGNLLTSNGSTWVSQAPSGGGGIVYTAITTNYTAVDKDGILANTTSGVFTVTLPASPATGAQVIIADANDTWGTNNLTVARNGATIEGLVENLICDISGISVQLIYTGTTWQVYSQVGALSSTGSLPVDKGGTGVSTLTSNAILVGNGTSAVQTVAPGTSGNILTSNGTTWASSAPTPSFTTGKAIAMAIVFGG